MSSIEIGWHVEFYREQNGGLEYVCTATGGDEFISAATEIVSEICERCGVSVIPKINRHVHANNAIHTSRNLCQSSLEGMKCSEDEHAF